MKSTILLLPGHFQVSPYIHHLVQAADQLIAVDGGIQQVHFFNRAPDLWIGDFDSSTVEEHVLYKDLPRKKYPTEKASVDTELAIDEAINRGADEIIILGGMGGRLDHQMALLMLPLQYHAIHFIYTDGVQYLNTVSEQNTSFKLHPGALFSILPLEDLKGVSVLGAHWNLDQVNLAKGSGLSISNRAKKDYISISCEHGRAWFYCQIVDLI